ncbi:TIR-like protein FxsC [Streptomyces sp. H10-C2]|uniref:TIR-like protein FxsC n=1 Tax=unclassified Streptomyces TaxID=2593676 RepID=UPI0024B946D7|nr:MULTISPECIES: TIR-like protein FxsC [unclassified Streptomyces]MDJ0343133.1 TIR-like protein FxsC [Streptomyces sp. PH10-H1]MDJ0371075.1 TIR-like protein FxsC [Streptomyces sp. H10-C2]
MHVPGQERSGDHAPYFFLSYAHTPRYGSAVPDPDMWVERLYQDLCGHVMALTDLPAGSAAGFMDREIHSGEGWSERLAESLATCRVFVPLFSPRYFGSAQCGKEWYAFAQRAIHQHTRSNRATDAIVPALWVPVAPHALPGAAERLQFNHRDFGVPYVTEGLYGLIKLRIFREDYERAVYELAKRIVSVAQSGGVEPGPAVDYRKVPSAFGTPRGARNLRVTVAAATRDRPPEGRSTDYYGESALDWNPFHPSSARPLASFAADLAHSLDYQATLVSFDEEPDRQDDKTAPTGPEILLLDRWALSDPKRRERLGRLDASPQPWVSVMVPWNRDDPESHAAEDALTAAVDETMPFKMDQGRTACRSAVSGIHSLQAFSGILPQVVELAAAQYLKHAQAFPPTGRRPERFRLVGPEAVGAGDPAGPPAIAPGPASHRAPRATPDDAEEL